MEIIEFFQGLDTEASNFFLIAVIVAFLFGLLIMLLMRAGRIRRLKRALKESEKELKKAQDEIAGLKAKIEEQSSEIERLKYDLQELNAKADRLEKDRAHYYNESFKLKDELEASESLRENQLSQIEALNQEIADLENSKKELESTVLKLEQKLEDEESETNGMAQMQSVFLATKKRLETLEDRLTKVEQENELLKNQISSSPTATVATDSSSTVLIDKVDNTVKPVLPAEIDTGVVEEEPEIKIQDEHPVWSKRIDINEYDKDDLTLIEGIGPFLEKKLNDIGIFAFEQIAGLQTSDLPNLTRMIGHIPGRIEQDNWIGQAQMLMETKQENPEVLSRSVQDLPSPENLTVIEGIGPQLEAILKEAGIHNWEDLAETDDEQLNAILAAAGPGYQIVDTTTWPAQAQLALNGEWELLKEYREELNKE